MPDDAECPGVGVEVVEHAGDLHTGGIHEVAARIDGRDGELAFQNGGNLRQVGGCDFQGGIIGQVGKFALIAALRPAGSQVNVITWPPTTPPPGSSISLPSGS